MTNHGRLNHRVANPTGTLLLEGVVDSSALSLNLSIKWHLTAPLDSSSDCESTTHIRRTSQEISRTPMSQQVWFISGASRGIGFQLTRVAVEHGYIVFAGARNPSKATALQKLAALNENVYIVKHDAGSASDALAVAKEIEATTGGLDVVVPNAAIAPLEHWVSVRETSPDVLVEHIRVNAVGPMLLYQALYPLLLKRPTRKFVPISTIAGSIANVLPVGYTSYGASKATLNFITKQISKENEVDGLIAFPLHPGMVNTDAGLSVAGLFGMERLPMTPEESGQAVFKSITEATKETSGRFMSYDGTEVPW